MRPQQPTFRRYALYAERDGLVMPESCMENEPGCNVAIDTSHHGSIYSGKAYRAVAELLADTPRDQKSQATN